MKRGKIAKMLGVDPNTITDWTNRDQFKRYFSLEARGLTDQRQRSFNDSDILVLNTIRSGRNVNKSWDEIAKELANGDRDTDLPPAALTVDTIAPIAQYGKIQAYEARIDWLEERVMQLEDQLERKEQEHRDELKKLYEELGMTKAQLKLEQDRTTSSDS